LFVLVVLNGKGSLFEAYWYMAQFGANGQFQILKQIFYCHLGTLAKKSPSI
jgi:hypothetical protein